MQHFFLPSKINLYCCSLFYNKRNMVHGHSRVSQFMGHRAHIHTHTRTRTYIYAALRSFRSGSRQQLLRKGGITVFCWAMQRKWRAKFCVGAAHPFLSLSCALPLTLLVCVCTDIHIYVCVGCMLFIFACMYVSVPCLCLPVCPH